MSWSALALLHLLPTVYMTGVIWLIQVVHYPLFAMVGEREFRAYETEHCRRITLVVLPPMVAELALSLWLCVAAPPAARVWAIAGLVLVLAIWASTFLLQVPCHDRLQIRLDAATVQRLVVSNWLRTVLWTGRAVIATVLVWPAS